MSAKKLLMLAIDAGDIALIRDSLGTLPTLKRVFDEGTFFPLQSTAELSSASIWPSFYTGQMPGTHGISQHIQWDPQRMRMRRLSSDWFYCEPFWYDLERRGLKVCAVDVPFTYPSRLQRGCEIMNWGSHDLMGPYAGTPAALGREIRRRFGKHPMGYEIPVNKSRAEVRMLYDQLIAGARVKALLLKWLTQTVEWDFFLGVFGECHRGGHILFPDPEDPASVVPQDGLLNVYRQVDAGLGEVLGAVERENTTVMVFSLHGMRANFSQEHFTRRVMDRINERFMAGADAENTARAAPPKAQSGLIRKLRESIPARLQYAVARSVPLAVRDWVVGREVTGGVDWQRTRGLALRSDTFSFVRFNLAGRERDGMLVDGSDDHRAYRDWVVGSFLGLRECGTDEPIVRDVVLAHDVLPGPRAGLLPDLIIRWAYRRRATAIYSAELGQIEAEPETGRTGEHNPNGFALLLNHHGAVEQLPPLTHNTEFPAFVRHLLGLNAAV
jgi:predicted AlkP superfamily phosphohydrolase/phosphomutase